MKKLLSPLLAIFLLTGCATTSNDTFEKNLECGKTKESRQKDFSGDIQSVFYSPKLNSCLEFYTIQDGPETFMILRNTFTNEFILKEKLMESGDYEKFQVKVSEY
jgi:hypothetical protein